MTLQMRLDVSGTDVNVATKTGIVKCHPFLGGEVKRDANLGGHFEGAYIIV